MSYAKITDLIVPFSRNAVRCAKTLDEPPRILAVPKFKISTKPSEELNENSAKMNEALDELAELIENVRLKTQQRISTFRLTD